MKKIYITITILLMFISILFIMNRNKKDIIIKNTSNRYVSILVDGVEQENFPQKETSKYLETTCLNNEEVEFDEDDWQLSIPHISASTNCVVSFMTKGFVVTVNVEGGSISEPTKTIQNGEASTFTLTPKDNTYMYSGVTCTGDVKTTFSNNVLTVSNVKSDSTCNVTYTNTTYDVTVIVNGGTAEKDKIIVPRGGNGEIKITPSDGYKLDGSVVDCNMGIEGIINRGKLEISKVYGPGVCTVNTACDDGLTINTPKLYTFTGDAQDFRVCAGHTYKVELWGAGGGSVEDGEGGKGGFVQGEITFNENKNLYLYNGGTTNDYSAGYNGGGGGGASTDGEYTGGGGASDIRLLDGEWNNFDSLKSRIIIAAGGAGTGKYINRPIVGGSGGGLIGYEGKIVSCNIDNIHAIPEGATQISGGIASYASISGGFGYAPTPVSYGTGGGAGYYGGGSGRSSNCNVSSGSGGSSFISGHSGCNAIGLTSNSDNIVHTGQPNHYSGLTFINTVMIDGLGYQWYDQKGTQTKMPKPTGGEYALGVGHSGNGYARVTRLEDNYTPTFTVKLNINNGTISKTSMSLGSGESDTATLTADTGYSLNGATVSCSADASGYINGSTLTIMNVKDNAECTVNTKPQTYVVTFNANGGTVDTGSKIVTYGSEYGELPTPTRKGYTFKGWNGKNLATPKEIYETSGGYTELTTDNRNAIKFTSAYEVKSKPITFKPNTRYTVSFDAKFVERESPSTSSAYFTFYYTDGTYSNLLQLNSSNWKHVTFTSDAGKTIESIGIRTTEYRLYIYIDIDSFQLEEGSNATSYEPYYINASTIVTKNINHTLTAKWLQMESQVTFDANGGSVLLSNKKVKYGTPYGNLPTPTRDGYTFKGWNGKNLFDIKEAFKDASGYSIQVKDNRNTIKYTGGKSIKVKPISFKPKTRYTVSFDAKFEYNGTPSSGTDYFVFYYKDGTKTKLSRVNSTDNWLHVELTSEPVRSIDSIGVFISEYRLFVYIDIDSFQFEESAIPTEYEPYLITDETSVVRHEDHTLKAIWNYTEPVLNGADPILDGDMIPVTLSSTNSNWTVTYADTMHEWYKYEESRWANAVRLVDNPSKIYAVGDTISHSDIAAYFVWIPRYNYKIFDMGNYSSSSELDDTKPKLIDIVFGTDSTTDTDTSCATPMTSGASGNCAVNKYMTHPAFISFNSKGFWVGKFETTGSQSDGTINNITVMPGVAPITNVNNYEIFTKAYNYKRNLDSHMMKNTEWGAVAYLSHSSYGMGKKNIYINNYYNDGYKTGCVGTGIDTAESITCTNQWYTTTGFNGSTTGNITGIYDMNGGVYERVAAYRNGTMGSSEFSTTSTDSNYIGTYNSKYFDVYPSDSGSTSWNKRILGDATGELGPFIISSNNTSSWYGNYSYFIDSTYPWFVRGGRANLGGYSGLFAFSYSSGSSFISYGLRVVLTPQV